MSLSSSSSFVLSESVEDPRVYFHHYSTSSSNSLADSLSRVVESRQVFGVSFSGAALCEYAALLARLNFSSLSRAALMAPAVEFRSVEAVGSVSLGG